MTSIITYVLVGIGLVAVILGAFLAVLWVGFRMGRQTIDKPLAPIIKPKASTIVEEDPWYLPQHGEQQPSYPTGADR